MRFFIETDTDTFFHAGTKVNASKHTPYSYRRRIAIVHIVGYHVIALVK